MSSERRKKKRGFVETGEERRVPEKAEDDGKPWRENSESPRHAKKYVYTGESLKPARQGQGLREYGKNVEEAGGTGTLIRL